MIFSAHSTEFDEALAFATDTRTRLRAAGRPGDDLRILPGTEIIVGTTLREHLGLRDSLTRRKATTERADLEAS